MATTSHAAGHAAHPERPPRTYSYTVAFTTREKCRFTAPYPAEFAVDEGHAVDVTTIDTWNADVVAASAPGRAVVSVTPLEPNDDYVPALILCEVSYPVTTVTIGAREPK